MYARIFKVSSSVQDFPSKILVHSSSLPCLLCVAPIEMSLIWIKLGQSPYRSGQVLRSPRVSGSQNFQTFGAWKWQGCQSYAPAGFTWYDMIYDMIWYDIWYDTIRYDIWYMIWYELIWYMILYDTIYDMIWYDIWYDMIWYGMILTCLLTAVVLTPGGSSTVHIYTQKQYIEQHN